jgi:protein gp37
MTSKIEWTGDTWNFIRGCTPVTLSTKDRSGCTNCYAKNMAWRLQSMKDMQAIYSCEPLLEPLSLNLDMMPVDLVITGYESGHGAREPIGGEDAVRSLRDQCVVTGTKFFYKQRVENGRKISLPELDGKVWSELP